LQRTHLYKHDLDWLPPSYRVIHWAVAGGIWTGLIGGMTALSIFSHAQLWGAIGPLAMSVGVAGHRATRGILRGRLRKLASGAVDLRRLPAEPDGELVHVSGTVRALGSSAYVYRRSVITFDGYTSFVDESGEDFWLVGEGEPVHIEVADARLLADGGSKRVDGSAPRVLELEAAAASLLPRMIHHRATRRAKGKRARAVRLGEYLLRHGDAVEILGYKSRTVDPTVAMRLPRDTPYRATLRGGRNLPLLIAPRPA
jgi:hypothetical protein